MPKEFKVVFTDLAKAFSAKVGGVAAVEEKVRGEIGEICSENDIMPSEIMFHTVFMKPTNGSETLNFICKPSESSGNTIVTVDTATYESMDKMKEGPFKGMIPEIPIGDSE